MTRTDALRRKRIWTVTDFAAFLGEGVSKWQAREMLKRWDRESGGRLLMKTEGVNRLFRFAPSVLVKLHPEIFDRVESLEIRVEELEEGLGELRAHTKRIVGQVGQNTRSIAKQSEQLRLFRKSA